MKDYGDPPKIDPRQAARKGVPELAPYIPGKPIHEVQKEYGLKEVIKLASNECPLALPDSIAKKILEETQFLCRYPDGHCTRLRISLARHLNVPPECLLFGNGADECIQLIALAFLNQGDEALIPSPSFDSYETFTRLAGAEVIHIPLKDYRIDLDEVLDRINNRTKMIWLCSPNNPTGVVLPGKEFERFLERISEGIVVILDEAYREYVSTKNSTHAEDYLFNDGRVIGLRTFSKVFGLAGLRVGYLMGHPSVVEIIAKVKLPFNVNNLAQAAALCALKEEDFVKRHISMIRNERGFLQKALEDRGLFVLPSETNFLFVELPMDGDELFHRLLPRGMIIRPGSIFGAPKFMRLSIGTREQNQRFLSLFDEIMEEI